MLLLHLYENITTYSLKNRLALVFRNEFILDNFAYQLNMRKVSKFISHHFLKGLLIRPLNYFSASVKHCFRVGM